MEKKIKVKEEDQDKVETNKTKNHCKLEAPQIKVLDDPMSVGDWIVSILLLIFGLMILCSALWGIYCICITVDTNWTISTHEGWNYLGEGEAYSMRITRIVMEIL